MNGAISRFVSAPDGLLLHVADYGAGNRGRIPVVCLAGLARNSRDFAPLALRLAAEGHRVIAPDYRGRGLSAWDRDSRRYDLRTERCDILACLTALGIGRAAFIGTSRGGLHALHLAAENPNLLACAVLNDIGPRIEPHGLMRIKVLLTHGSDPADKAEAVAMLRRSYAAHFPALAEEDWVVFAAATTREINGQFRWDYDPALAEAVRDVSSDTAPVDLWPQMHALACRPVLVIRGERSDLLSADTLAQVRARLPHCRCWEVPGQGHAPLLMDKPTIETIVGFLAEL